MVHLNSTSVCYVTGSIYKSDHDLVLNTIVLKEVLFYHDDENMYNDYCKEYLRSQFAVLKNRVACASITKLFVVNSCQTFIEFFEAKSCLLSEIFWG